MSTKTTSDLRYLRDFIARALEGNAQVTSVERGLDDVRVRLTYNQEGYEVVVREYPPFEDDEGQ